MNLLDKIKLVAINSFPVFLMIGLIKFIENDLFLTLAYLTIIGASFFIKYEKNEFLIIILGIIVMTISETIFILTGVETFNRNSLLGIMPLWLPLLWGYAFVVMKRSIKILNLL